MHEARSYYSSRNRADWDCNRFSDFVGKVAEAHDLTLHRDALPKRIQLDPDFLTVIDKLRAQRLHDRSRKWSFIGSVHPAARASMWPNLEQSRDANVGLTPVIDVQVERTFFDLIGPSLFASGHRSADLYDFMRFSSRIGFFRLPIEIFY